MVGNAVAKGLQESPAATTVPGSRHASISHLSRMRRGAYEKLAVVVGPAKVSECLTLPDHHVDVRIHQPGQQGRAREVDYLGARWDGDPMGRPNRTNPGANHLDNGVIDDFAIRDRTDFLNGLTITRDSRASGTKDPTDADVPARGCVTHQANRPEINWPDRMPSPTRSVRDGIEASIDVEDLARDVPSKFTA